jgi:hypothetical protein
VLFIDSLVNSFEFLVVSFLFNLCLSWFSTLPLSMDFSYAWRYHLEIGEPRNPFGSFRNQFERI